MFTGIILLKIKMIVFPITVRSKTMYKIAVFLVRWFVKYTVNVDYEIITM